MTGVCLGLGCEMNPGIELILSVDLAQLGEGVLWLGTVLVLLVRGFG